MEYLLKRYSGKVKLQVQHLTDGQSILMFVSGHGNTQKQIKVDGKQRWLRGDVGVHFLSCTHIVSNPKMLHVAVFSRRFPGRFSKNVFFATFKNQGVVTYFMIEKHWTLNFTLPIFL